MRKHTNQKLLSLLLALLMLVTVVPFAAAQTNDTEPMSEPTSVPATDEPGETSNRCGDNVYWSFDESTATLTVSGSGDMWNFDWEEEQPWFDFQDEIQSLVIEDGVTSIGEKAFSGNDNLSDVTIPESVQTIKLAAFMECPDLKEIRIPNGSIESQAFDGTGLQTVYLGAGVNSVNWFVFQSSVDLQQFVVDENNPFYASDESGCLFNKQKTELICYPFGNSRTSFSIPDNVELAELNDAKNLESLEIPDTLSHLSLLWCNSLKEISVDGNNPFFSSDNYGCFYNKNQTELIKYPTANERVSFTVPDTVKTIKKSAFEYAGHLTHVQLPENLETIEHSAFAYSGLEQIQLPDGLTIIDDSTFNECINLADVQFPANLQSIGRYAFEGCSALTTIALPDAVASIGLIAFARTSLETVVLPASVSWVDNEAFYTFSWDLEEETLKDITVLNPDCEFADSGAVFGFTPTLHGYRGSTAQAYAENYGLKFFAICPTDHANTTEVSEESASCTENGYTAGVYCNDCEQWISGHDVIEPYHTDADGDGICDICGEDAELTIRVGETLTVDVEENELTYIRFVPTESGVYTLTSLSDEDTIAYLCDRNKNPIAEDDESGEDSNFSLTYKLTAGEIYYFGVRFWITGQSGSFDVQLIMNSSISDNQCGDNAFWSYDAETATLTISGTGTLWNKISDDDALPWDGFISDIETVVVEEGITSLPGDAFFAAIHLTSVTLPQTLESIGADAFFLCTSLQEIDIPDNVSEIGTVAFAFCTSLTSIKLPENLTTITEGLLLGCYRLQDVEIPASVTSVEADSIGLFMNCYSLENIINRSMTLLTADQTFNSLVLPEGMNREHYLTYQSVYSEALIKYQVGMLTSEEALVELERRLWEIYGDDFETIMEELGRYEEQPTQNDQMPDGLTFRCYSNSAEQIYCEENGIAYALLDEIEYLDEDTHVSITYEADAFDPGVEIDVTEIPTGNENSRAWNITPTLNGEKVQSSKPVLVKLPIPAGWDKSKIVLIHTDENGNEDFPPFTIEGDFVVFWADSFSEYVLELEQEQEQQHVHTYDAGVETKAPYCMETGVKTYTCTTCEAGTEGHTKTEPIPALGHAAPDSHGNCSRCGTHLIDVCKWCGKQHNGFFQGIIAFFHRIFATLFGAKY